VKNNFEGQSQPIDSKAKTQLPASTPGEESVRVGLASLAELAKTAYDDNRRKYCLALTAAILKIDPSNNEARHLQSLIHTDINVTVQRLHVLIEDPRWKDEDSLRKSARRVLKNVLDIDPLNEPASTLLREIDPPLHDSPSPAPPDASLPRKARKELEQPESNRTELEQPEIEDTEVVQPQFRWVKLVLFIIPITLIVSAIVILVSAIVIH